MSSTVVYGCDWCKEIVEKDRRSDKPRFAAKVTIEDVSAPVAGQPNPALVDEICSSCRGALDALRQGRFRR